MQQEPERASTVRLPKIECKSMGLGEAGKLGQSEVAEIPMSKQIRQNIVAVFVPRSGWRTRGRGSAQL